MVSTETDYVEVATGQWDLFEPHPHEHTNFLLLATEAVGGGGGCKQRRESIDCSKLCTWPGFCA
jgi:hypothetical protein